MRYRVSAARVVMHGGMQTILVHFSNHGLHMCTRLLALLQAHASMHGVEHGKHTLALKIEPDGIVSYVSSPPPQGPLPQLTVRQAATPALSTVPPRAAKSSLHSGNSDSVLDIDSVICAPTAPAAAAPRPTANATPHVSNPTLTHPTPHSTTAVGVRPHVCRCMLPSGVSAPALPPRHRRNPDSPLHPTTAPRNIADVVSPCVNHHHHHHHHHYHHIHVHTPPACPIFLRPPPWTTTTTHPLQPFNNAPPRHTIPTPQPPQPSISLYRQS